MHQPKKKPKYRRGFKKWSQEKALELRKELGLNSYSPLCAFKLCKHLEIPVLEPKNVKGLPLEKVEILLGKGSNLWSAVSIPINTQGKYLIVHNPNHSSARQQSNLMHELAHIICEHKIPEEKNKLGLSGFLRNHDQEQEDEAEWFGSSMQLPREALLWSLKRRMSNNEISIYYNASIEMVRYRINISGVKRQLAYIYK